MKKKLTPSFERLMTMKELGAFYGVPAITGAQLSEQITDALGNGTPFSVIRAGDIMAKTLSHKRYQAPYEVSRKKMAYAGLPGEITPHLQREIHEAMDTADVVGVIHFKNHAATNLLRDVSKHYGIQFKTLTSALGMRELYFQNKLFELFTGRSIMLVGRQAGKAAKVIEGKYQLSVVGTENLENYAQLKGVEAKLAASTHSYDAVLVAAGVPARLLCPRIARQRNIVALDIGHVMDEVIHPGVIGDFKVRNKVFKNWEREKYRKRK
ncbi:GT-D fold domain-containing glycosyltransferase [Halobacillus yeomjeoni]|uniref:GT-D fold-like domain-containing protein n=1 Tax=Halobacillus yeomjeoni TaxID=311194 RepID=A0A931HXM8_9BACI|nr:GT-D fold domain-containing glycosyltransferase [Halobacillus yeomjeoni]MBH0231393.1 hypothetical protein [Halobacillus yeomjeoni]